MNETDKDTIVSCGVDYITATCVGPSRESSLASFGRYLVGCQEASGEQWRDFRFSGYRGAMAGGASFGVRYDSQIVRLSSGVAQEHWAQAFNLSSNVTRLDIQFTTRPGVGPTRRLLDHHRQVRRRKRLHGRPPRFKFWYGPTGPEAATFGSRKSDKFGRSYDKGLESGLPEWLGTLRYECELKGDVAISTAELLDQTESESDLIIPEVLTFFSKSGCRFSAAFSRLFEPAKSATDSGMLYEPVESNLHNSGACRSIDQVLSLGEGRARRQALWLNNAVRPSVQRLMDQGRSDVVLSALGLSIENGSLVAQSQDLWSNFNQWR